MLVGWRVFTLAVDWQGHRVLAPLGRFFVPAIQNSSARQGHVRQEEQFQPDAI